MELGYYEMSVEGLLRPCDAEVAGTLMADENARIIATTDIDDGFVSTAFLPICLMFEDGSPQAFETVVLRNQKSVVAKRYSDLAEALKGHDLIVESLK